MRETLLSGAVVDRAGGVRRSRRHDERAYQRSARRHYSFAAQIGNLGGRGGSSGRKLADGWPVSVHLHPTRFGGGEGAQRVAAADAGSARSCSTGRGSSTYVFPPPPSSNRPSALVSCSSSARPLEVPPPALDSGPVRVLYPRAHLSRKLRTNPNHALLLALASTPRRQRDRAEPRRAGAALDAADSPQGAHRPLRTSAPLPSSRTTT